MKYKPFFSVVMPTNNRADLIPKGIQSVINQKYENWELIIVDDGSTDHTKEIVNKFPDNRIKYVYQENKERSAARNLGIELARGEYICFLDDDDYLLDTYLDLFFGEISKQKFPTGIFRVGYLRKSERQEERTFLYTNESGLHPAEYFAYNFCGVWSLAIHRDCLQFDKFPNRFRHWQDTHLILRLLSKYSFYQIPDYGYVYQIYEEMGSKQVYFHHDARGRIQSNVDAIHHLFKKHESSIKDTLPSFMEDYLVSEKYLNHANGSLKNKKTKMAIDLVLNSLKTSKGRWWTWAYFKFFIKLILSPFR